MNKRVLWFDNDRAYLRPYVIAMEQAGIDVDIVGTITAAKGAIAGRRYDAVILDVMIPTKSPEEDETYTNELTKNGILTGLVFYERELRKLAEGGMPVLVLSVLGDKSLREAFADRGVTPDRLRTKVALKDVESLVDAVKRLFG